ncbi:13185_t:CDS:2 [Cetraspora pellucida]|uniref:13185_t:CDS:1 n=1 Tax=Cetraspora pellucida TaxID=1433469 RepID=A0A9N9FI46_9GLOM|nr:13185_t:CDS:2 [Cetraspora pellucida]
MSSSEFTYLDIKEYNVSQAYLDFEYDSSKESNEGLDKDDYINWDKIEAEDPELDEPFPAMHNKIDVKIEKTLAQDTEAVKDAERHFYKLGVYYLYFIYDQNMLYEADEKQLCSIEQSYDLINQLLFGESSTTNDLLVIYEDILNILLETHINKFDIEDLCSEITKHVPQGTSALPSKISLPKQTHRTTTEAEKGILAQLLDHEENLPKAAVTKVFWELQPISLN